METDSQAGRFWMPNTFPSHTHNLVCRPMHVSN